MTTLALLALMVWAELRGDPHVTVFSRRLPAHAQRQAFTVATIARLPFWEVFKAGWPFTLVLALVTLLVTYVPWISLGLVNLVNW